MSVIRIRDRKSVRPTHVVMILIATVVLAGSGLFLSAADSGDVLIDGAKPWAEGSVLRAVVQFLCLGYRFPTINAGDVKALILGLGAGFALITLGVSVWVGGRSGEESVVEEDTVVDTDKPQEERSESQKRHIAPLVAAQALAGLFLLWSLASFKWSHAPALALGGSILIAIQFFWAFSLGNGLSSNAGKIVGRVIVVVAALTALIAIWYHSGRNPILRAKFPYGNPTFLAACLIPGILLAFTLAVEKARALLYGEAGKKAAFAGLVLGLIALGIAGWAFKLADSRGASVGLVMGFLAVAFFALRGRQRFIPIVLAIIVTGVAWNMASDLSTGKTDRGATVRFRGYSWSYALEMLGEKSFVGYGEGGFTMLGDARVARDIENDPLAFSGRVAHAHNEWLEIGANLGSLGLVLILAVLVLTLHAGRHALDNELPPGQRWVLIGLLGSLVGLIIEECFGNGLRVSGVPTAFYTTLGLLWALCRHDTTQSGLNQLVKSSAGRLVFGAVAVVLGLGSVIVSQMDFDNARSTRRIESLLAEQDYEEAIAEGNRSVFRLNPQRVLMSQFRLAQAHVLAGEKMRARGLQRRDMAIQAQRMTRQTTASAELLHRRDNLLTLAQEDLTRSFEHAQSGSIVLMQLLQWSPGYLEAGHLEFMINRLFARIYPLMPDAPDVTPFVDAAKSALERELRRQPFNEIYAVDYIAVAVDSLTNEQIISTLARPLRHNSISGSYFNMLLMLRENPEFVSAFQKIVAGAKLTLLKFDDIGEEQMVPWAPEVLRMSAAMDVSAGRYDLAESVLITAAHSYESLKDTAPIGAASCYFELADTQFKNRPAEPHNALLSADRASALCPSSEQGRALKVMIDRRRLRYELANDHEEKAREIAMELAPRGVAPDALDRAISQEYSSLCLSLLRRPSGSILIPAVEMPKNYSAWIDRSLELNPANSEAHYLAADRAALDENCPLVADHITKGLRGQMPLSRAWEFVGIARGAGLNCDELESLWISLDQAMAADPPRDGAPLPAAGVLLSPDQVKPSVVDEVDDVEKFNE